MESQRGIDTLLFIMREQTSVIVGPSGVGKSSLINAMRFNKRGAVGVGEGDNCSNLVNIASSTVGVVISLLCF